MVIVREELELEPDAGPKKELELVSRDEVQQL